MPWAVVESGAFLCRAQAAGKVVIGCMSRKLLHRRTGVLAPVYVHFFSERGVQ